jgi:hypothetical protein
MRTVAIVLAWSSAALAALPAQQQTPDAVPRELAIALLDQYGISRTPVDIVVGRPPRAFPPDALPREGARVLGGAELGWGSSVVIHLPGHPDSAASRVAAHLQRAGWRNADRLDGAIRGGFFPNPTTYPVTFCRANAVLRYAARAHQDRPGSLVYLSVSYPDDPYSCSTEARLARRSMRQRDYDLLPRLETPTDARFLHSSWGPGGRNGQEAYVRLETSRGAASTAAHYVDLLRRNGWQVSGPTTGQGVVIYRTRMEKDKRQFNGALMVLDIEGSDQLDVVLRMATPDTLPQPPRR